MKRLITLLLAVLFVLGPSIPAYAVGRGDKGQEVTQVQYNLRANGYSVAVDGTYGAQTEKAIRHWQKANGLLVDGIAGPITTASLAAAVRTSPPAQPLAVPNDGVDYSNLFKLDLCGHAQELRSEYGLPSRFDQLAYRESKCHNDVRTYCCYGIYQLYWGLISKDHRMIPKIANCGVNSLDDIYGETVEKRRANTCVAKALYDTVGYSAWSL